MREQLVAWAEDCRVQGEVDLGEGRLSDVINELDVVVFRSATLVALRDGHIVREDEVEVARRELTLIQVEGRRGDPLRRLRTIAERVRLEVDPFRITGDLHHLPSVQSLNALTRWSRFIPVTDALVEVDGSRPAANRARRRARQPRPHPGLPPAPGCGPRLGARAGRRRRAGRDGRAVEEPAASGA